jgi:hypothetical protein
MAIYHYATVPIDLHGDNGIIYCKATKKTVLVVISLLKPLICGFQLLNVSGVQAESLFVVYS